jgi:hypothetical protein
MKKSYLCILIASIFLLTACNSFLSVEEENVPKKYVNEEFGFSIEIPDSYGVEVNDSHTVLIISEMNSPKRDVYLSLYEQEGEVNESEKGISSKTLKEDVIVINGFEGFRREHLEFNDPIGEPDGVKCTSYDFYLNETKYSFSTHACRDSDTIGQIVNSFRLLE